MVSDMTIENSCSSCSDCGLKRNYQIARNVMSSAINPDTQEVDGNGIALLVYDARNPGFIVGGAGDSAFRGFGKRMKKALSDNEILRRTTWQAVARLLADNGGYGDLLAFLSQKYGIETTGKR